MLDVFNSDAFSVISLTASVNKLPFVPAWIGQQGLFTFRSITTPTAVLEERNGKLYLIPTSARGTMSQMASGNDRKVRTFRVPHMQLNAAVMADDVSGIRAFGTEDQLESVNQVVNDKLETLRQSHEYTHEWHRLGAIKGVILDADGSTEIYDLFDEFGLTQDEIEFDFTDADMDVKTQAIAVKRLVEDALGMAPYQYVQALVGDDFFDALVKHASVKGAYEAYQEGRFSMEDQRAGFEFPTGIRWHNYRGKVGSTPLVAADECHFYPVGVPELFLEICAPADFIEAVNTPGQLLYAKQERLRYDTGVELHTQSNVLEICTRPQCLVKGTATLDSGS